MNMTTIGIDLAKNTFSLHGTDAYGKAVLKKTVSRGMSEFGLIMPQGRYAAQHGIPDSLEDAENDLPSLARRLLRDVWQRIVLLNQQILAYDRELDALARQSKSARKLMTIPGIGAITATALVASIVEPRQFRNGRQLAAWLGLTPRQYSTGGKPRLGRITEQGDKYLRMLLIHDTRAVLAVLKDKQDRTSLWLRELVARRDYKHAAVALAAKNARIVWAILNRGENYRFAAAEPA